VLRVSDSRADTIYHRSTMLSLLSFVGLSFAGNVTLAIFPQHARELCDI
jgi:hypothetical protein